MRAVIYERFGDPKEVLTIGEQPVPQPGPGQVRLALIQAPIHHHDLSTIRGSYGYRPELPAIAGTEAVATVDALGEGVAHLAVGQRVCASGKGTWAEYFLANAATAVAVPPSLPDESACQLVAMPLSAAMLLEDLKLGAGDFLIQNAANGTVGRIVDTLARERQIRVINLVRRQSTAESLIASGVERVLATDDPRWAARAVELAGGAPIARALDSVGGPQARELLELLAPGGVLVSFGVLSGQALAVDPRQLIFQDKSVRGFWALSPSQRRAPAELGRMIGDLVRLVATGALPLRVARTFELARAAQAAAASTAPDRAGKIALRP